MRRAVFSGKGIAETARGIPLQQGELLGSALMRCLVGENSLESREAMRQPFDVPSKSGNQRAVTIYEIAKHVGVSPAAFSSVLANRRIERRIAARTAERIQTAALDLGYVPNVAGRRLRAHRAATRRFDLAILTSFEAPLPLVGKALHALQLAVDGRASENTRYSVSIELFHAGRLSQKPRLLDANRYHGVIVTNTLLEDDAFLARFAVPYVVEELNPFSTKRRGVRQAPSGEGAETCSGWNSGRRRNPPTDAEGMRLEGKSRQQ